MGCQFNIGSILSQIDEGSIMNILPCLEGEINAIVLYDFMVWILIIENDGVGTYYIWLSIPNKVHCTY